MRPCTVAIVGLLASVLVALGCRSEGSQVMTEGRSGRVTLSITGVRRATDALVVAYSLRAEPGMTVWVLDQLFSTRPSGQYHLEPERAYVEAEDGVLLLSRALHPVPDDIDVESPEVPCARELVPGRPLTGEIRVPLPPREDIPYREGHTLDASALREVRLTVGYLTEEPDPPRLREATDDEGRRCLSPSYATAVTRQQRVEAGPVPLPGS